MSNLPVPVSRPLVVRPDVLIGELVSDGDLNREPGGVTRSDQAKEIEMDAATIHRRTAHDSSDQPIVHDEQLERMIAAYDRPIATYLDRAELDYTTLEFVRRMMRQAIEQAWDAGHACQKQHGTDKLGALSREIVTTLNEPYEEANRRAWANITRPVEP